MHINVLVGAARPLAGLQGLSDYSVRCRVVYRDRTKSGPLQEVQAQFLRLYIAVLWRTCRYWQRTMYSQVLSPDLVSTRRRSLPLAIWFIYATCEQ